MDTFANGIISATQTTAKMIPARHPARHRIIGSAKTIWVLAITASASGRPDSCSQPRCRKYSAYSKKKIEIGSRCPPIANSMAISGFQA